MLSERMLTVEKDNFMEKLKKLVELGKSKNNTLDINDINDFFTGVTPVSYTHLGGYSAERWKV